MTIPKKSLGQNFLRDASVVAGIIQAVGPAPAGLIMEVGPGEGVLTEALAGIAGKVAAIEIDAQLIGKLKEKFKSQKNVVIVPGDILKTDIGRLVANVGGDATDYAVVANLPYYITSPILKFFLENEHPPRELIVMVQKEVAERICSDPGDMSILAVAVQYYAKAEILFEVSRTAFWPVPEVDSAVIRIGLHADLPAEAERKNFFRVVRAGFCARRKTLSNNLANSFHLDKTEVAGKLKSAGLEERVRAQDLPVAAWRKLAEIFRDYTG